jgi:predicted O-linked N-acetylglucosamine transferase (SPINDLY family)
MVKFSVDRAMQRAEVSERKGALNEARNIYESILERFPNNARARNAMSALDSMGQARQGAQPPTARLQALLSLYQEGQFAVLAQQAADLVKEAPTSFFLWNILGAANQGLGRPEAAELGFRKAAELYPDFAEAHCNLANMLEAQGRLAEATASYERAVRIKPDFVEALNNLGTVLKDQGRLEEAIASYERALRIKPDLAEVHNNLGTALRDQGRLAEAIASHERALRIKPGHASAHNNLGNALMDQGRLEEAVMCFREAVQIRPDFAEAHNNLGTTLRDQGSLVEATASYERALQIRPDFAEAHNNLGTALKDQGRLAEAITSYERALRIKPGTAELHSNLGAALFGQGRLEEAIARFRHALRIKPDFADVHNNLGNALVGQGRLDEAVMCFAKAIEIEPDHRLALSQKLHQQAHMCDWAAYWEFDGVKNSLGIEGDASAPFSMLAREDHPERQAKRAQAYARQTCKRPARPLPVQPGQRPEKIRLGYFSAHFHDHATLYLMSGLLREHDKSRFEIYAYSYGATRSGEMRSRAARDVDHFIDVSDLPDQAVVDLARAHRIDIAIDLMGYTQNTRSRLLAYRLAPVQINYLVYPGTMGADFIDYIIADPVLIPEAERPYYSEKILYLPHSYQPNDNQREIAPTQTMRVDFGLPEDGFVFCCFNNNYKISPREFDIWMRLLGKVDGSVLWLLRANKWSEANLRQEARQRGIDPGRLVFAERLPHAEHLARHKHANLFLDTFNYNAHTTASDALWSGLPVVTKAGRQFAARVAASLLSAAGLPELITETEEDYEAVILDLATAPERLAALKSKLAENRLTQPLFDTARYTRDFEQALEDAFEKHMKSVAQIV